MHSTHPCEHFIRSSGKWAISSYHRTPESKISTSIAKYCEYKDHAKWCAVPWSPWRHFMSPFTNGWPRNVYRHYNYIFQVFTDWYKKKCSLSNGYLQAVDFNRHNSWRSELRFNMATCKFDRKYQLCASVGVKKLQITIFAGQWGVERRAVSISI